MRISLKEILVVFAFVAVILWCGAQVGFDNEAYLIVLVLSGIMSACFIALASSQRARWAAILCPIVPFFFCAMPLASMALLINIGLLVLSGIACTLHRYQWRAVTAIAMVCMMASFVTGAAIGRSSAARLADLRAKFPPESLADRINYEQLDETEPAEAALTALKPAIDAELIAFEDGLDQYGYRRRELEKVHSKWFERFIRADGFGIARIDRPGKEWIDRPPLRDIPFAGNGLKPEPSSRRDWTFAKYSHKNKQIAAGEDLHALCRNDFLDPDGLGFILSPIVKVVGFVEHAAHYSPAELMRDSPEWTVTRMELVSLLRFDEPRVYVLDHLPRMDQLSSNNAPTRDLDDFEKPALERLRTDEDVVIEERDGATRMLGSLRAANQCLDCHSVQRGELLGAFTYVLHRSAMDAPAAKDTTP